MSIEATHSLKPFYQKSYREIWGGRGGGGGGAGRTFVGADGFVFACSLPLFAGRNGGGGFDSLAIFILPSVFDKFYPFNIFDINEDIFCTRNRLFITAIKP